MAKYRSISDVIAEQLDQEMNLPVGREIRSMTKREAIVTRAIDKATKGDLKPLKNLLEIAGRLPVPPEILARQKLEQQKELLERFLATPFDECRIDDETRE